LDSLGSQFPERFQPVKGHEAPHPVLIGLFRLQGVVASAQLRPQPGQHLLVGCLDFMRAELVAKSLAPGQCPGVLRGVRVQGPGLGPWPRQAVLMQHAPRFLGLLDLLRFHVGLALEVAQKSRHVCVCAGAQ
jgi:hypothetical protein